MVFAALNVVKGQVNEFFSPETEYSDEGDQDPELIVISVPGLK
jgi:hypothetical protein